MESAGAVSCAVCGTTVAEPPLGWTSSLGARGTEWICVACTRRHLRGIEGKLDPEAW